MDISKPHERRPYRKRGQSVMYAAHYQDGRTAYSVLQGSAMPEHDFQVLKIAKRSRRRARCQRAPSPP